jgi:hypothetical protein
MEPTSQREIEVLFWIVLPSLIGVVAATVALVRSGRTVSLPMLQRRPRLRA